MWSILRKISLAFLCLGLLPAAIIKAASFNFVPSQAEFIANCMYEVTVKIDTEGATSNAADLEINYDPSKIEIIDSDPNQGGIQVGPGDAYTLFIYNQVDSALGKIRLTAASASNLVNGTKVFAKIQFKSLSNTASVPFNINFTGAGNTLDSNIAESNTSKDLLTSVTNANYSFNLGSCPAIITPTPGATITPSPEVTIIPSKRGNNEEELISLLKTFNSELGYLGISGILATAATFASLLNLSWFVINLLSNHKGGNKPWGIIYAINDGSSLSEALVELRHLKTDNPLAHSSTDATGKYYFNHIPEGNYKLRVSLTGFKNLETIVNYSGEQKLDYFALEKDNLSLMGIIKTVYRKSLSFLKSHSLTISVLSVLIAFINLLLLPTPVAFWLIIGNLALASINIVLRKFF